MSDYYSYLGVILCAVLILIVIIATIVHFVRKCTLYATLDFHRRSTSLSGQPVSKPPAYSDERCSICLDQAQYPVQTCCGHLFCANCILKLWESENEQQLKCPNCRRLITLFFELILINP